MTTRRAFMAAATTIAAGAAIPASSARAARRWLGEDTFFDWTSPRPGVHATQGGSTGGNVMVVVAEGAALIVDSKFGPISPALRHEAEAHGAPIKHLVNTHHHADHTSGNVAFSSTAQVWANEKARPRIVDQVGRYMNDLSAGAGMLARSEREPADWMLQAAQDLADRRDSFDAEDWAPGRTLQGDYNAVTFGAKGKVECHHAGAGHTDNDVFVRVPEANVVHAGDLLFNQLHPYYDAQGGVSNAGWIESLQAVIDICDDETVVVPGHGPVGDVESLRQAKRYHEQLREKVALAIDAGKTREETAQMTWPFMEGLGFERVRPMAIGVTYDQVKAERG